MTRALAISSREPKVRKLFIEPKTTTIEAAAKPAISPTKLVNDNTNKSVSVERRAASRSPFDAPEELRNMRRSGEFQIFANLKDMLSAKMENKKKEREREAKSREHSYDKMATHPG